MGDQANINKKEQANYWEAQDAPVIAGQVDEAGRKLYDVSIFLDQDLVSYPGEKGPSYTPVLLMANGEKANVTSLTMGAHTGTHIDAPIHFIEGGKTIAMIPLSSLIGSVRVVDAGDASTISADFLATISLEGVKRVLFKTKNSLEWAKKSAPGQFKPDFVYIAHDAAPLLVKHNLLLVGVDYLSVEQFGATEPETHRTLLGAGTVIIEGLNLHDVPAGDYELIALPLRTPLDGCPARVILRALTA